MTPENLLHLLVERGFRLTVDGETLRVAPAAKLDEALRQEIACHKAALLDLLAPPTLTPEEQDDIAEAVEERAAIREFDAGEDRATAEAQAVSSMRVYRLLVSMGEGQADRWLTMLAPGCDLAEAERTARLKFGSRLLAVIPNAATKPTAGPSGPRQAHQWGLPLTQVPLSPTAPQIVSETVTRA